MRVAWALPCRYTEVHDNLATIVGGGISNVQPQQFPAVVSLMLAIRLVFLPDEADGPHSLRIAATSPDGTTLAEAEGSMNFGRPEAVDIAEDELQNVHVPMAIQWTAETPGLYMLNVTVDGDTVGVPIRVQALPTP